MPNKITEPCIVCNEQARYHGPEIDGAISHLCSMHYQRWRKKGDPFARSLKDPNEFIIYEDHAEVVLYDKHCEEVDRALISLDKVETAKQHVWCVTFRRGKVSYVTTHTKDRSKSNLKMHQVLFDIPEGMVGDHINLNVLDNRNENIRICRQKDNSRNLPVKKNNTSGVSGVEWNKTNQNWRARIKVNYKGIDLGSYTNIDDAIRARLEAEIKYFGNFAPQAFKPEFARYTL